MYNTDIKRAYINKRNEECILPNNYLTRQFKKISSYENKLNKDIYEFSNKEIIFLS